MKRFNPARISPPFLGMLALALVIVPQTAKGQTPWQLTVGAQNEDGSKQAMAFLPNEIWIHVNDSVTWTTKAGEGHTVTFLKQTATGAPAPGTTRPANGAGCTGDTQGGATPTTPSGSSFDGTGCVNSGSICDRTLQLTPDPAKCPNLNLSPPTLTYTVNFPKAGNFKFVCLIHHDMTGVVHVLSTGPLPHNNPDFYEDEAAAQTQKILADSDHAKGDNDGRRDEDWRDSSPNTVITTGELAAHGGGRQFLIIARFLPGTIYVNVGDTVEWINMDPTEPHTVTFDPLGPSDPNLPKAGTGVSDPDTDNDLEGTLPNAATCAPLAYCFNSGTFGAANQDQTGQPQPAPGKTHVKVTFTKAGEYDYFCTLHPELGMVGKVIVK
jgi:plastocyanin